MNEIYFNKDNNTFLYLVLYFFLATSHLALDILFIGENILSASSIIRDVLTIIFAIVLIVFCIKERSKIAISKDVKRWSVFFILAIVYYFIFNIYLITMSIINVVMYWISSGYPQFVLQIIGVITIVQVILSIVLLIYSIKLLCIFSKKQKSFITKIKKYRVIFMIHIFISITIRFIGEFYDGFGIKEVFRLADGIITMLIAIIITLLINEYLDKSSKVKNTFIN